MESRCYLSKITIRTLIPLDVRAIKNEAIKLGLTFKEGDNDGITNIFHTTPNLNAGQKAILQSLINKIGTGTITP